MGGGGEEENWRERRKKNKMIGGGDWHERWCISAILFLGTGHVPTMDLPCPSIFQQKQMAGTCMKPCPTRFPCPVHVGHGHSSTNAVSVLSRPSITLPIKSWKKYIIQKANLYVSSTSFATFSFSTAFFLAPHGLETVKEIILKLTVLIKPQNL